MKTVATVVVRMGSQRLPGKTLKPILDRPVLGHLLDRLRRARTLDEIVIATSVNPENDVIESFCRQEGAHCFRGSENDVLGRVLAALESRNAEVGVEVFGDSPLLDWQILDELVLRFKESAGSYDFVSNDLKTTYPPGTEVEVYAVAALRDSALRCQAPEIREHGTLFIRQNPERYRLFNLEAPPRLHFPEFAMELDTQEDLVVIEKILRHFLPENPEFLTADVIAFLAEHPEIRELNSNVERRWRIFRNEV